jgi:L-threonylcarbamoyladenylate synthase
MSKRPLQSKILRDDSQGIERAARLILQGGVVAFPTETFYALGADALNEQAIQKVYAIKGRDEGNPLLLLVAEKGWVPALVKELPPTAEKLIARFWPGPLTLVFEASPQVPARLTGHTGKVGIRIPGHPVARDLIRAVGRAVTGTSANPSGMPSASSAGEVMQTLGGKIDAVLDGGRTAGGLGSTVLDISSPSPVMVRQGAVPAAELLVFFRK